MLPPVGLKSKILRKLEIKLKMAVENFDILAKV